MTQTIKVYINGGSSVSVDVPAHLSISQAKAEAERRVRNRNKAVRWADLPSGKTTKERLI